MAEPCAHFAAATVYDSDARVCPQCVEMGSRWVHLRMCLVCGQVGCCDNSPNKHATAHFHATHDPVIRSIEPGDAWAYCYVDDLFVDEVPR